MDSDSFSMDVYRMLPGGLALIPPGDPVPVDFRDQFMTLRYGQLAFSERASFPIVKTEMFVKGLGIVSKLGTLIDSVK